MKFSCILCLAVLCVAEAAAQAANGNFRRVDLQTPGYLHTFAAADVNGDGALDLLTVTGWGVGDGSSLLVFLNDGHGTFTWDTSTGNVGGSQMLTVELNGDRKVDVVTMDFGPSLSFVTNTGVGEFYSTDNYVVLPGDTALRIVAADFNGDGKMDLIAATALFGPPAGGRLTILTNSGTGFQFGAPVQVAQTIVIDADLFGIVALDVNGDGKPDVVANSGTNTLSVFTNRGDATFALSSTLGIVSVAAAADVNGDGKADLISSDFSANMLTVLTNDGHGGFAHSSSIVANEPGDLIAADMNVDGKPDLISFSSSDNKLNVLTNDGSGGFILTASLAGSAAENYPIAADFDGDGVLDLLTEIPNTSTLILWLTTPGPFLTSRATGNQFILSWPASATGFVLQSTPQLTPPVTWTDVTNAPVSNGERWTVTNSISGGAKFYRLRKP
jgi:hypothetical protein